jgi:hypothetical protein
MLTPARNDFLTARAWHRSVVGGKEMILRRASALEFLQLWNGYIHEKKIDVFAKKRGEFENIDYHIVDSFDGIDYIRIGDVLCTSPSHSFNEMLADSDDSDETALIEGLAEYYHAHGKSFDGLSIASENRKRFEELKGWAAEHHRWS